LVVLYHVGGVYEAAGMWGWFWIVDDPDSQNWLWFLPVLFSFNIIYLLLSKANIRTPNISLNAYGSMGGKPSRFSSQTSPPLSLL